jgi:glycosyltransferase involved in cell wall biosynthesis
MRKRLGWTGVGATILPLNAEPATEADTHAESSRILLQFGSAHASRLMDYSFATLQALRDAGQPHELVFVGMTEEQVGKALKDTGFERLRGSVRGLGYRDDAEVSRWMRKSEIVLAPFIDGVSARRTSVISALAHGCAVATTAGVHTDPSVPWGRICSLASSGDREGFVKQAIALAASAENRRSLGDRARRYYETAFSWPVLARNLVRFLRERHG